MVIEIVSGRVYFKVWKDSKKRDNNVFSVWGGFVQNICVNLRGRF